MKDLVTQASVCTCNCPCIWSVCSPGLHCTHTSLLFLWPRVTFTIKSLIWFCWGEKKLFYLVWQLLIYVMYLASVLIWVYGFCFVELAFYVRLRKFFLLPNFISCFLFFLWYFMFNIYIEIFNTWRTYL